MNLAEGRVDGMVRDSIRKDTAIICHSTLEGDNAVCRGFFDRHRTQPLRLAERLRLIEYVAVKARVM